MGDKGEPAGSSAEQEPPFINENSERTKNRKGRTYHVIGEPEQQWISSLPTSYLPLLDAGSCYGVQTMYAMKHGRDVIALDCCEEHITILRERVANMERTDKTGHLRDSIVTQLPSGDVLDEESVPGILCSEVIHFMTPTDLRLLFHDFYRWMVPGGKLVVVVGSWPPRLKLLIEKGVILPNGITLESAYDMLENSPASEVVDAGPGMLTISRNELLRASLGDRLYLLSTEEVRYVSENSGFVVEELRYYSSGKYGDPSSKGVLESVLLVASKPAAPV